LHLAWWFPVSLAILPGAILGWRKVVRPREIEFADILPLCWMGIGFLPLLFLGERQDYYSFSMWTGFALFAASAWDRLSRQHRLCGIGLVAVASAIALVLAVFLPRIVNSASDWKELSERATAWQTFTNIPGETWLGFRLMLALAAGALLVGAIAAFCLAVKERGRAALIILLAAMIPLGLGSIDGVAQVAPFFSLAKAATYLNDRVGETGGVYYEGPLHAGSSLVFYLNRRFYLVNQRTDPFTENLGAGGLYVTEDSVLDRWRGSEPVFLIIEQDRVPHWQQLITDRVHIYHQVTTCGTYVVLSNQL
jgi:hypothetical protein